MSAQLGQRFIEPQTAELAVVFKESSPTTPLIFVLSQGTDPAADLYKFAEEVGYAICVQWYRLCFTVSRCQWGISSNGRALA